jgi:hypothetical protein
MQLTIAWEFFWQGMVMLTVSFGVSAVLCKFFSITKEKEDEVGARIPGEKDELRSVQ